MAIKNINVTLREAVQKVRRYSRPIITGADKYVATGDTLEQSWTGSWAELEAKMTALAYDLTNRLSCTLTRLADGDHSELRATWTTYTQRGADDGSGGGTSFEGIPGSSRDNPTYSVQVTSVQEPLLTHPNYNYLTDDYLTAMKMLMDGYKGSDTLMDSRTGDPITIDKLLSELETGDDNIVTRIKKGQTHYMAPHVSLTCRYKSDSVPTLGTSFKIATPPGEVNTPPGHDWLFLMPSIDVQEGEIWVNETYLLSGPGGWDKKIYS